MTKITNKFTDLQEQWLQLLETTDLPQGSVFLCRDGEYCCLGLAAEFILKAPYEFYSRDSAKVFKFKSGSVCSASLLDFEELNLVSTIGAIRSENFKWHNLSDLNDSAEYSFKEIASFIRENPWLVFTNFEHPRN